MRVSWSPDAFAQLRRNVVHIARDNRRAALELAAEMRDKALRLGRFPYMGRPGRVPDTRELVVRRNYVVTYRVLADEITVVQVWHVARRPPEGGA